MKLITWNVNSLNARQELVSLFLDAVQPDVFCIQELKLPDERVPRALFEERGYHLAVHGQPRWNGVLIASKEPMSDVHVGLPGGDDGQSRLIAATIGGIRIINLYCPQGQAADSPKFAYKLKFFDVLCDWIEGGCDPAGDVIVTGDINIAPEARDIYSPEAFAGVPSFHPEEHKRWARMTQWGLEDAMRDRLKPNSYTFWDYRGGSFYRNNGMRIDHFLVSASVMSRVQDASVHRNWRKKKKLEDGRSLTASDHAPVELLLSR